MEQILCIAEKMSLAEAAAKVFAENMGVKAEFDWTTEAKSKQFNQVGNIKFVWLDGHAFENAMPDHYLPDSIPKNSKGSKVWRSEDLPIVPDKWEILPKEQKTRRLAMVEEALKNVSQVYHMGDPDEEGQVLVDECLLYYGYKGPVKRILINDYNTSKVKAALDNIRDNSEPMFRSWYMWGLARSHYDWLLGLNATRAMTLRGRQLGIDGLLPVGSVQTPLLYVVRERDRVIENFKPVPYYTISAMLKHENGSFRANWKAKENQTGLDPEDRLIDASVANSLAERLTGQAGAITAYTKTKKQTKAPLPLSMNELQMDGFSKYGYSGTQVLEAGQKLYEIYKVMSYPRSDNRYLSEAQHAEAPAVMAAVFKLRPDLASLAADLDIKRKSDAFNDKKMEGTPHHGIVPSVPEAEIDMSKWSDVEKNVYELVVRSYLAQFAAPYEYHQTSIEAELGGETFTASGRTPIAQGWKAIYAEVEDEEKSEEETDSSKQTLPVVAKGDAFKCDKCEVANRKTKAPPRFDDKMLIDCMMNIHKYVTDEKARKRLKEGDGIGTTATRAPMIQDMKDRQLFIPVKEGSAKLMTSAAARALIDALPMDVKDPAQAGVFKASLDRVAKSSNPDAAYTAFMNETVEWVKQVVEQAKSVSMAVPVAPGEECPVCKQGRLRRKEGKDGFFWGCSRWNAEIPCKATYPDKAGKPNFDAPAKSAAAVHSCPNCKTGQLRKVPGKTAGQFFWGCTNFYSTDNQCKTSFPDVGGKPNMVKAPAKASPAVHSCPNCKSGQLRKVPSKTAGQFFWGCTNFYSTDNPCKSSFPDLGDKPNFASAKKSAI
ncbi:DNA topoisomerase [Undibacterium sp. TS12]|uniref:DNA topoisomerase n=1 Tax=Undibacterium sp. TS12 TaxID=2908202 RepID=UPI001F4CBC42|nr:DNA topoisomerase [Undibacterium sp. TS12]MCH8622929.1 DNA topoisomerase [Undibacterium sp. TS12]